jgi:predicted alpha/beta hydrolase family esterase
MVKQVLFVQGGGKRVHDEWDDKLVQSLTHELGRPYDIRYPRMPHEADPKYASWKAALAEELARLDDGAIVVAHSIGATILINALAEHPPKIALGGIFLVAAPFIGRGGWPSDEIEPQPQLGVKLPRGVPIYLYHGSDDDTAPPAHLDLYAAAIPQAIVRRLPGRNHQLNDDLADVARDIRDAD